MPGKTEAAEPMVSTATANHTASSTRDTANHAAFDASFLFTSAFDDAMGVPAPRMTKREREMAEKVLGLDKIEKPCADRPAAPKETRRKLLYRLIPLIEQMMYVSGETGEPSVETTLIIEEIVRQQVVEIVSVAHLPVERGGG